MFPDLFTIGPMTLHTYGLFVALGFTAGLAVTLRLGRVYSLTTQQLMDMAFVSIVWGIVGARLLFVLINLPHYRTHPMDVLKIWQGGLVFSGGLLAVAVSMLWYGRRHHLSFWMLGDLCAPGVSVGQALGRIGCFMAGCCYGKPTDHPFSVVFTHPDSLAPLNIPLHPTQIYDALIGLLIFAVLLILHGRKKYQGQVVLWFLILHSTGRLLVEKFRADHRGWIPGTDMSVTQLAAMLILLGSVLALFLVKSRERGEKGT
ncbi:MAG: prolipoprotein diacylglyceryl transferase [Thermodesulfobacteriota bacterium]